MKKTFLALLSALLAGCQTPAVISETEFREVKVPVPAPCPDPDTMARVNAARPVPLRNQVRPADEDAAIKAQLGLYERPSAWADQAQAVMDRCFQQGVDTTP